MIQPFMRAFMRLVIASAPVSSVVLESPIKVAMAPRARLESGGQAPVASNPMTLFLCKRGGGKLVEPDGQELYSGAMALRYWESVPGAGRLVGSASQHR
jgi:hypothetical protein